MKINLLKRIELILNESTLVTDVEQFKPKLSNKIQKRNIVKKKKSKLTGM